MRSKSNLEQNSVYDNKKNNPPKLSTQEIASLSNNQEKVIFIDIIEQKINLLQHASAYITALSNNISKKEMVTLEYVIELFKKTKIAPNMRQVFLN